MDVLEVEPAEDAVVLRDLAVHARNEGVVVERVHRIGDEVPQPRCVGRGVGGGQLPADWIQPRRGDQVALERQTCARVADGRPAPGEVARHHCWRRNATGKGAGLLQPQPLVGGEEPRLVDDAAAAVETVLVAAKQRDLTGRIEHVLRVEGAVAMKFVEVAVELVRARARDHIDLGAGRAAELRRVGRRHHPELLDGVGRGVHDQLPDGLSGVVDAIEPEEVGRFAHAMHVDGTALRRQCSSLGRRQRTGDEQIELEEVASVERQFLRLFRSHHRTHGSRAGLHHWQCRCDGHLLAQLADFQRKVDALLLIDLNRHRLARRALEALERGGHTIDARREQGQCIVARRVGGRRPLLAGAQIRDRDGRPRHNAPIGIADGTGNRGGKPLAAGERYAREHDEDQQSKRPQMRSHDAPLFRAATSRDL